MLFQDGHSGSWPAQTVLSTFRSQNPAQSQRSEVRKPEQEKMESVGQLSHSSNADSAPAWLITFPTIVLSELESRRRTGSPKARRIVLFVIELFEELLDK